MLFWISDGKWLSYQIVHQNEIFQEYNLYTHFTISRGFFYSGFPHFAIWFWIKSVSGGNTESIMKIGALSLRSYFMDLWCNGWWVALRNLIDFGGHKRLSVYHIVPLTTHATRVTSAYHSSFFICIGVSNTNFFYINDSSKK